MLQGGIGCVRFQPAIVEGQGRAWFMSVKTNPVLVTKHLRFPCAAGLRRASACAASPLRGGGALSPSSARFAGMGSRRPASSTVRSTASASAPMSSSCSFPSCGQETSSSSIISAATKPGPCARCSRPSAQGLVPAALLTRSQLDRKGLLQNQTLDAPRPEAHLGRPLALCLQAPQDHPPPECCNDIQSAGYAHVKT
jgi:hypothetical protein